MSDPASEIPVSAEDTRFWLLCPTAFERRAVAARLRRRDEIHVEGLGVGPRATTRSLVRLETMIEPADVVLLVGLCAGLHEQLDRNDICVARRVIGLEPPAHWSPSWPTTQETLPDAQRVSVLGVDRIIADPDEKRQLGVISDARILDMESHAFAGWASGRAWQWGIVRVVLDTVDDPLPDAATRWIREDGAIRRTRVIADAIRSREHRAAARALGARANAAMTALTTWLDEAIGSPAS